ncbi:AraC family transcriptional regulator [Enterococcus sp. CSURQ0835]|uniref:AraC family transcriptional regulator n=1 Tax=Enterococcus sp. CSURQ0835 TaxID=2681394 RepID=UPI00135B28AA|nr:AraC family transcriptional regulator [Enterococcus sp. CSURQ0835]
MDFFQFDLSRPVLFYKGGEFSTKTAWRHQSMFHQGDYELIYCLQGTLYLTVGEQNLTVQQHDLLIIPPFTKLVGFKDSPAVDFLWLHFFSQTPVKTLQQFPTEPLSQREKYQVVFPALFTAPDHKQTTILLHQLLTKANNLLAEEEKDFLLAAFLIRLFGSYLETTKQLATESPIETVKEWIRANISSDLTVTEIAEHAQLTPDHLTRLFKKYTGLTTLQYLNQQKIKVAQLLLMKTDLSIKEIAKAAYFNSDKVFMRQFKKEFGSSPTAYRHLHQVIHHNNPTIDPQIPVPKKIAEQFFHLPENGNLTE